MAAACLAALLALVGLAPVATGAEATVVPAAQWPAVGPLRSAEDLTEGLRVESSVTYTVDLPASVVHVEYVGTLTHQMPDTSRYFYTFEEHVVPALAGATGVAVSRDDGAPLGFTIQPETEQYLAAVVVDLGPALRYGQTRTVRITYDLPAQQPRVATSAQVNTAFATFPVVLDADPGLGSVHVVVPDGPEVEVVGDAMAATPLGGSTRWTAEGVADPAVWFAQVVVRDDDALVPATVDYDDGVSVRGWPNDPEWLAFTTDLAERGLPALEEAIGRPWTAPGDLTILEAATPNAYGYAGWYEHRDGIIEIGDTLDAHVTLHELAHAWFNGTTFDGRWIGEALADEYAAATAASLGLEPLAPSHVDPAGPGAVRLADWADAISNDPETAPHEEYGYNASWWVLHEIAAEIGHDGLSEVVGAAMSGQDAYPAGTDTKGPRGTTDWQRLLDLLEEVGGSQRAAGIFRDLVAGADDVALVDERSAARAEYQRMIDAGEGWAPPAVVRDAMADWDFRTATAAVPQVLDLFDRRDALAADLRDVDLDVPDALRAQVENAAALADAEELLTDATTAVGAVVRAADAEADAGPLDRLGLAVAGAEGDQEAARAALDEGRYADAAEAAERASAQVEGASARGAIALTVLVLLVGTAGFGTRWVRRRH
jgi:hypothetical protein